MTILSHPNQIRVGFQKRKDTYNGLLSYMIYMNSGLNYGKEKSFNNWIDPSIPVQHINNDFQTGFVLNKSISRRYYSSANTVIFRIYHPNGWEFEIRPSNFANICANCDISSGEIMEPCAIVWDGAELILLPQSFVSNNLVEVKYIDVISKIAKSKNTLNYKISSKKTIPYNKLKAENIYLHANGKEYFLSGFVKNKKSLINFKAPLSVSENGTEIYTTGVRNFDTVPYIFPYSIDGNNTDIIDDKFLNGFISKVDKIPQSSITNIHELMFIPFHKDAKFSVFSGEQYQKDMLSNAVKKVLIKFKNSKYESGSFVLPMSINLNNENFMIGIGLPSFGYHKEISETEQNLLKKNNLIDFKFFLPGEPPLALMLISTNSFNINTFTMPEFLDHYFKQQKQELKNLEDTNTDNMLENFMNIFKQLKNSRADYYQFSTNEFSNRVFSYLTDLINTNPQPNDINLSNFALLIDKLER